MNIFAVLLSLVRTRNLSDQEKDLEILILHKQLTILQRTLDKPIRPNHSAKLRDLVFLGRPLMFFSCSIKGSLKWIEESLPIAWDCDIDPDEMKNHFRSTNINKSLRIVDHRVR